MKKCKVCGSKKKVIKEYCFRHYMQIWRHGKIFNRTSMDKNEIFDEGDHYRMALYNTKQKIIAYTLFDKEDLEKIKQYKWCLTKSKLVNYAITSNSNSKTLLMHRIILNAPNSLEIDHINGDGLDNRKNNIRLATHSQNRTNQGKTSKLSTSKYLGVGWNKQCKTWRSEIRHSGRSYSIGRFKNELHAAMARDIWAKELHGKFAYLNFP